eukprot:SAG31_NODE_680_length_12881_cov_35.655453_1_plen_38_part_00
MNKRETLLIYIESHNQERYTRLPLTFLYTVFMAGLLP